MTSHVIKYYSPIDCSTLPILGFNLLTLTLLTLIFDISSEIWMINTSYHMTFLKPKNWSLFFFYWVLQLPFLTCVRYVCLSLLLANIFMLVISSHVEKIIWNTVCGFFLNLHWLKRLVYKLPYKSINMPPVFFILLHFHMDNQNKVNGVCFICILYCTLSHLYTQKHNDIHKLTRIMQRKTHFFVLFCIPASSINRTLQILANSFYMS